MRLYLMKVVGQSLNLTQLIHWPKQRSKVRKSESFPHIGTGRLKYWRDSAGSESPFKLGRLDDINWRSGPEAWNGSVSFHDDFKSQEQCAQDRLLRGNAGESC
jgi:hypothetical protein